MCYNKLITIFVIEFLTRNIMIPQKKENAELTTEQRIARRVKAIRILRGYTQKQLAELCGYSNATICNIEKGGDYKISTLHKIEEVLEATLLLIPNEDLI